LAVLQLAPAGCADRQAAEPARAAAGGALVRAPTQDDASLARLDLADKYSRLYERIRDNLGPPQWLKDGERFVYWSAVGPHRGTWVLVDAQTQAIKPLLPADQLQGQLSQITGKPVKLPEHLRFTLTPDHQSIVFRHEPESFALRIEDGRITRLAPDDMAALALSEDNLGFAVLGEGGRELLRRGGEDDYEWQVPPGAWSPDGRFLMVFRNDARKVHRIPVVDYTTALERVKMVPYTKTGTPLVRSELYIVEPATGRVTQVPPAAEETYDWLAGWRPDSSEALVLHLSRDGKRLDLAAVSAKSGAKRLVLREERPESFVGALDFAVEGWALQVWPLKNNRHFLWMSERDGWRHAYLYDYAGKLERQVTSGAFPVHQVAGVTRDEDALFLLASADRSAPYDRLLYRVNLAGGDLTKLSPEPGVHRVVISPSGRYYMDGHSTRAEPRAWDVRSTDGRTSLRYAKADASALAEIRYAPPEPITVLAADGVTPLYGVLYKPWDFDARKRYAVIDHIYAGPFLSVVPWSFVGNGEARAASALAQMGFVVMVLDARGTPGRGKAFQDANYGRVGQTEIPDHAAALRQAAAARPYMDMERVGIHGSSWGGYFALRGMLTAPELFKAGYAGAPGALEEEAIINEPNLGLPSVNPAGYAAGSNLALAKNLRGALKIMHGTSDVNASLSTTMRMADALIREGKRFELLLMPGQPHSLVGPARRYYDDDVRLFFVRELGGPR
jgi:dipeptidyl aminopeptidase/acylaminoacyl peptidase